MRQMHRMAFFRLPIIMFLCYMDAPSLAIVLGLTRSSGGLDVPPAKLLDQMFAGAPAEAMMLIVVVLSVQFRKTLASQAYKFGTSCV